MIDEMKRQKRELVYKGSILDIYKDTMQFANGKTEEWDFVSHRKGAAAVLPVLDDGRIIMVRQYRNALERETIEIPAGCRDFVGEDTRLCAERELKEETGYSSDDISFLLSLRTTVAFCDEEVDVYLAKNLKCRVNRCRDIHPKGAVRHDLCGKNTGFQNSQCSSCL